MTYLISVFFVYTKLETVSRDLPDAASAFSFYCALLAYVLPLFFLYALQIGDPNRRTGVAWHPPVSSRREGDGSYFRSVRQTGTLKLLGEKSPVKLLQPLQNCFIVITSSKRFLRDPVDLGWLVPET